jgi:exopolyphosphatase / guanosine-5'-triphosphate,3'-diphosphate pyrophosphatase
MKKNDVYVAIDLGTNACRLTIATLHNGRVRILETFSKIIQFGESLYSTGVISQKAIYKAIKCLKESANKIQSYNVTKSMYVATEACRKAKKCR